MKLLQKLLNYAPYLRNKYILVLSIFGILLLFFDDSNIINQWKFSRQINDLENQRDFYIDNIHTLKEENDEITGTPEKIEKFAREKHLMKRPNEDIFVIIQPTD